ncbi:MAG: glycosyltransferase family 4 protein [Gammaproteobacteria bacterium]|nr:glycosyltransferase family 4 protein [Gammaproteobacteria bacterium]
MMQSSQFDICIVGLKCYDLLVDKPVPKYLGGIERILVAFARTLSSAGVRVAFITFDEGQGQITEANGITIFKAHNAESGFPLVRLVHPRMTAIWRRIKRINAPVCLQMGAGVETLAAAIGAWWVGKNRTKFFFFTASNMDCESSPSFMATLHEKILYRLALKIVDAVVCQTQTQAQMMKKNYGLDSTVIPMPSEAPEAETSQVEVVHRTPKGFNLLWVGRTVKVKRLEWFLDIAEMLPEATLHIVGSANRSSEDSIEQLERAKSISNVIVHGRISDQELFALYQDAFALCCTSIVEGFPTTFLEAWKIGLPVITTFDPDDIILKSGAGRVVASPEEFVFNLNKLRDDKPMYDNISKISLNLYKERFSPSVIIKKYLQLFNINR